MPSSTPESDPVRVGGGVLVVDGWGAGWAKFDICPSPWILGPQLGLWGYRACRVVGFLRLEAATPMVGIVGTGWPQFEV